MFVPMNVDLANYRAICLLEKIGNYNPSQRQIDKVEKIIYNYFAMKKLILRIIDFVCGRRLKTMA